MTDTITTESPGKITGSAHRHDDETLLLLALLTLGDVEDAAAYWRRLSPDPYKGLANARKARPDLPPEAVATASVPAYDPAQLAYVRRLGDVVDNAAVRIAVLETLSRSQAEARRDTLAMLLGALALGEWQDRMSGIIKRLHVATAAVGVGGTKQLTGEQLARSSDVIPETMPEVSTLGDLILFQYGRLNRFATQIEMKSAGADNRILSRVELYGASAYPTYQFGRRIGALVAGFTQERNVLSPAEHCRAKPDDVLEDCPTQTERGWVDIGELVPVGQRLCGVNCKCKTEFRRVEAT